MSWPRWRSRTLRVSGVGTRWQYAAGSLYRTYYDGPTTLGLEECGDDANHPNTDHDFYLKRVVLPDVTVSGQSSAFRGTWWVAEDVPWGGPIVTWLQSPDVQFTWVIPGEMSWDDQALAARANANPNVPKADFLVDFGELRELPELLHESGTFLRWISEKRKFTPAQKASRSYLMAKFGWAPILSDLATLLNFVEVTEKRETELRRMNANGGTKLRRSLGTRNGYAVAKDTYVFPTGVTQTAHVTGKCTIKYWYSMHAHLDQYLTEREIKTHAFRSAFGVDYLSLATLWELLPWSWLVDWFANTGSLARAFRGGLPWTMSNLNLMKRVDYDLQVKFGANVYGDPSNPLRISVPDPRIHVVQKHRKVGTAPGFSFGLRFPYLGPEQLGVLTSLAILRL